MPKPNYQFQKRQRDLALKQKKQEKRLKKLARQQATTPDIAPSETAEKVTP